MNSEIKRGRAELRDVSAARGVYEVDYIIHISTRTLKKIDQSVALHHMVSASIQPVNAHNLKNGIYELVEGGSVLYNFEKAGTTWKTLPPTLKNPGKKAH